MDGVHGFSYFDQAVLSSSIGDSLFLERLHLAYGVVYKPVRDGRIGNHASVSNRRWFLEGKPFLCYRPRVLLQKATPKAFWMREA